MIRRVFLTSLIKRIVSVNLISGLLEVRSGYKVREPKNYWSVEGSFSPLREEIIQHLRASPNHKTADFQRLPLEEWTLDELQSIHSDHHEGNPLNILG